MFTIWFRDIGAGPCEKPHSVTLTGLEAARLAWTALGTVFVMLSAKP